MDETKEKKVWISVQVPASIAAALGSIAMSETDTTRSDIVRRAIRREIVSHEKIVSTKGKPK